MKDKIIAIRITAKIYNCAMNSAEKMGMNISEYIRYLIAKDLEK